MKYLLLIAIFFFVSCNSRQSSKSAPEETYQEIPENAVALFDGKSLDGWEVTGFGTGGPIRISAGKIIINMGDGCSGINRTEEFPKINYEVGLEARKTQGNDFFCGLTFPVKNTFCSLIVGGWGGPVIGLSTIDGLDASENETRILKNFTKGQWYKIRLRVDEENIMAWIDDEKVVDFSYADRKLGIRPEVTLSKPFGVCTWMTSAEIKNVWLIEFPFSNHEFSNSHF